MEILGIGPSELVFIIIIALIVLGPKDMQKAGKTVGRWLNDLVRSDGWKAFQQTSKEIRSLPTKLMREANMEMAKAEREISKAMDTTTKPPASPASRGPSVELRPSLTHPQETENTIQPPSAKPTETDSGPNEKNS
jgi:sec-independent protein translocase protein TatB